MSQSSYFTTVKTAAKTKLPLLKQRVKSSASLLDIREGEIEVVPVGTRSKDGARSTVWRVIVCAGESTPGERALSSVGWILDDGVSNCLQCNSGFTAFKRRHHCRACGLLICADCSKYKSWLGDGLEKCGKQRICSACIRRQNRVGRVTVTSSIEWGISCIGNEAAAQSSVQDMPAPSAERDHSDVHGSATTDKFPPLPPPPPHIVVGNKKDNSRCADVSVLKVKGKPGFIIKTRRVGHAESHCDTEGVVCCPNGVLPNEKIFINVLYSSAVSDPHLSLMPCHQALLLQSQQRLTPRLLGRHGEEWVTDDSYTHDGCNGSGDNLSSSGRNKLPPPANSAYLGIAAQGQGGPGRLASVEEERMSQLRDEMSSHSAGELLSGSSNLRASSMSSGYATNEATDRVIPIVYFGMDSAGAEDKEGFPVHVYNVLVSDIYFSGKEIEAMTDLKITDPRCVNKILQVLNKQFVDCLNEVQFTLPLVKSAYKGDAAFVLQQQEFVENTHGVAFEPPFQLLQHHSAASSSNAAAESNGGTGNHAIGSKRSSNHSIDPSAVADGPVIHLRGGTGRRLSSLLRGAYQGAEHRPATRRGSADNGDDQSADGSSLHSAGEDASVVSDITIASSVAEGEKQFVRGARRFSFFSSHHLEGNTIVTADMLHMDMNRLVSKYDEEQLKRASWNDPKILLGWQIMLFAGELGAHNVFVIIDTAKNNLRKTEYKISNPPAHGDAWVKLKRSETKTGIDFRLLRKVINFD